MSEPDIHVGFNQNTLGSRGGGWVNGMMMSKMSRRSSRHICRARGGSGWRSGKRYGCGRGSKPLGAGA